MKVTGLINCRVILVTCLALPVAAQVAWGGDDGLSYQRRENVVYAEVHGVGLIMDVFQPAGSKNGRGIVEVVSGAWHSDRGKLKDLSRARVFDILCRRGYTVFAMRPGSVSKFSVPEMVAHVESGIRWVKERAADYEIDAEQLGLMGASAGGHLACLTAVVNGRSTDKPDASFAAAGIFFPPTDFLDYGGRNLDPRGDDRLGKMVRRLACPDGVDGLTDEQIRQRMIDISPARRVTENAPPFLLIHGDADFVVPIQQSRALLAALEKNGVPAHLIVKKGGGHPWPTVHEEVAVLAAWFDRQLAVPAEPIALHPDNPHYFLWRDQPTILITSGEHYGALLNLDFDYVRYFDTLQSDGLNHTRTFSGVYRENPAAFHITDNTLAPKPQRYICPWARSDAPGYHDGGNKFDLTRWDEAYFERLRRFMIEARKRDIIVEMTLFCPMYKDDMWRDSPLNAINNVNGIGTCPRTEVFTLQHDDLLNVQLALTRKLVRELHEFGNLYFEICNEPYFGGVTMEWQERIIAAITEAEKEIGSRHLISLNIANGQARVESPHPDVSIFNFHYCVPPTTVAMNFGLNKVIGENETGFRGGDDVLYRTEGWDFLLAGGALYNNLDYSFTCQHPDGTFRDYKSPGGGSPELRRQLGILKQFLDGFDFVRMKPDPAVIRAVSPQLTASALVEAGKAYAIYLHVPLPKNPKDLRQHLRTSIQADVSLQLPAGEYSVDWIDTKTGAKIKDERLDCPAGVQKLTSPRFDNDVALRLMAIR